jgi:hypothetical protein
MWGCIWRWYSDIVGSFGHIECGRIILDVTERWQSRCVLGRGNEVEFFGKGEDDKLEGEGRKWIYVRSEMKRDIVIEDCGLRL